jgi:PAS domain S-box-containing protein
MGETKKNITGSAEKYFKLMVENSLDVITVLQLDGKIIFSSPSAEKIAGYSQEDLVGRSIFELTHPDDLQKVKAAVLRAIKNPRAAEIVKLRIKHKNGSWIYFESRGVVSASLSGLTIIVNSRDITKTKEAEEKVNAVLDQTSQLFGLVSVDGVLIKTNKTALQFCGVEESDVLNKPFWDTVWWAHSKDLQEKLREAVKKAASGEIVRFEANHLNANKDLRYIDFTLKPFKDETDKVTLLIAEGYDITDRKKLEGQILKEKQEQESILDSIPALIFYKDKENRFIHVNSTYSNTIGILKKDLEGKSGSEVFPKEQSDKFFEDDKKVIKSGKAKLGIIEEVKFPDGNHWVRTDKIPFKNENGNIIGIIGFAIDITESKTAEDKQNEYLEELEKFKNLMIGRELKMIELKQKIADLEGKIQETKANLRKEGGDKT